MIGKWLFGVLFGYVVHVVADAQIEKLSVGVKPTGAAWRRITRYSIGYVACFFTFWYMLPDEMRNMEAAAAYFMGGVSFGGGVAIGYALDNDLNPFKDGLH